MLIGVQDQSTPHCHRPVLCVYRSSCCNLCFSDVPFITEIDMLSSSIRFTSPFFTVFISVSQFVLPSLQLCYKFWLHTGNCGNTFFFLKWYQNTYLQCPFTISFVCLIWVAVHFQLLFHELTVSHPPDTLQQIHPEKKTFIVVRSGSDKYLLLKFFLTALD